MSRREYPAAERYEEREADYYRRPRHERDYEDLEVDISHRTRYPESRRAETVFKEKDTVIDERRGPRRPDFLREDYGKAAQSGQLVIREDRREEDSYVRRPARRRDVDEEKITIRERSRGPPYPRSQQSELDFREDDEVIFRERTRSRAPPPREERSEEKIDISIRRDESRPPPPKERERDIEEITFRRGGGELPDRARSVVDREEIDIRESRSPAPRRREVEKEEIDIDIDIRDRRRGREDVKREIDIREERSVPPRQRSMSRGALVAKKSEEWIVRRERDFTPPPRDYEKEEIIIRRKERTPSPEPPREPTPEPPPPPLDPIYRPPIIQEYITHHRHIDHGVERARSPTPPPPSPPSPPKEDDFEVEIRRTGTRNGKAYNEEFIFEKDQLERSDREVSRRRDLSVSSRRHADREFEAEITETRSRSRAPSAPPPRETKEEIKITESRSTGGERSRRRDRMWTEVAKDLVIKEAVVECNYEFEETDDHFYVMEYLRYEDVLHLVEVTEDIRRERRERLKELQWQREESERRPKMLPPAPAPPRSRYDERVYEREYVYDRDGRRYRRG